MKSSSFLSVLVFVAASALALHVLPSAFSATAPPAAPDGRGEPALSASRYSAAAETLRRGDLQASRLILRKVARQQPSEAANSRLLEGFYAYERGRTALAERLLAGTSQPGGPLEDWRLLLLAESADANGHAEAARNAMARLAADFPESPLRPQLEDRLGYPLESPQAARPEVEVALPTAAGGAAKTGRFHAFHAFDRQIDWDRLLAAGSGGRTRTFPAAEGTAAALPAAATVERPSMAQRRLSIEELRRLYASLKEAGLFDSSLGALRLLRRVDPWDTTGTRDLWEQGWAEYRQGNPAGAVGYWTALAEIYPEQSDAQRGRYWQARALESLGQPERARGVFLDLVAASDTTDFYHRQALVRLGRESSAAAAVRLAGDPAPWPGDGALRRAKLLTDLGLDGLAEREMEIVAEDADPRDLLALRGLIGVRRGDLRGSMSLLRRAYPALGGPSQGKVPAEILHAYYPLRYTAAIVDEARERGLPPSLVAGIIRQESSFDPLATSPAGARGLMQLMPETAREVSGRLRVAAWEPSRLYDPETSVRLGAAYFRQVLDQFDGNVELALAGYNGGPSRIRRLWREAGGPAAGIDEFLENLGLEESRDYVKRILVLADSYRQLHPEMG